MAVLAYVFIQVAAGKAFEVLKSIRGIEGVKSAHTITGEYDIVAFVEATSLSELGGVIVNKIQKVEGVTRTVTAIVVE